VTAAQVAGTIGVVVLAALLQSTMGFGFALLSMPILAGVIGAEHALAIVSLVSIVNSLVTASSARGHVDMPVLRSTAFAALLGMPIGLVVLETLPERAMRLTIAATVAVAAIALGSGLRVRRRGHLVDGSVGLVSGILATSTGTSGPPLVVRMQGLGLPAATVRATLSAQFVITGLASIALLAARRHIRPADVGVALVCLPALWASWRLGSRTFVRLGQHHYDRAIVVLLCASAVAGAIAAR
jgi:uncharacterized membrane protein YfcA